MCEQEQIEAILRKLEERVPNMRSTLIVISILHCLLTLTPGPDLKVAWVYTTVIEQVAHQLANDPEKWTYQGKLQPRAFRLLLPNGRAPTSNLSGVPANLREAGRRVSRSIQNEHRGRAICVSH